MKLSRNRPWSRLRSLISRGAERLSRAGRLARSAGAAPLMEPLETRQLLFALEITPGLVDPNTGVGTLTAFFGYTIPHITSTIAFDPQPDTIRLEEFTDEARGIVPSGRVLLGSLLQVTHDISPAALVRIQGLNNQQGQPQTDTNELFVQVNTGQRITFRTVATAALTNVFVGMRSFQVDIRGTNGSQGINLANFRVELRFQGSLIAAFQGASGPGSLGELNATNPGLGIGTFVFASPNPQIPIFDEVTFIAMSGPNDPFVMDNIQTVLPAGNFASQVDTRIFGAELHFTGPAGARVEVFDLYGRSMQLTLALGRVQGSNFILVDLNDDGIPDFNDGIGRIVITGANELSSLTVAGGRLTVQGGVFNYTRPQNANGQYNEMENAGFGFRLDPQDGTPVGMPPGPGSVIIGSPYNRPQVNYNPLTLPPSGFNFSFSNPNQGIFVQGSQNFGTVYIHGVLMGSSKFNGFVHSIYAGTVWGSVTVRGDLGAFYSGGDAGIWQVDDDWTPNPNLAQATGGQLIVERTLGELTVGGRLVMDVTVRGDLNSPVLRPARDVLNYYEREHTYGILRATPDGPRVTLGAILESNDWLSVNRPNNGGFFAPAGQTLILGNAVARNDALLSAEWIGSIGTAVQLYGSLGGADPLNTATDLVDVYSFAADGQREIAIEFESSNIIPNVDGLYARVVDAQGRVVAGVENDFRSATLGITGANLTNLLQSIRFTPDAPGAYYLVLMAASVNLPAAEAVDLSYMVTISGMAATTLGLVRSGAQTGHDNPTLANAITLLGGSVGSFRPGSAIVNGAGAETDPISGYNEPSDGDDSVDHRLTLKNVTVTIPGTLYDITAGSDIEGTVPAGVQFIIGGDFGTMTTGLSPVAGTIGPDEGDVGGLDMQVGGRIAYLNIKGAIGIDQDPPADPQVSSLAPTSIRTGAGGGNGSIGLIRVGEHVRAGNVTIVTSPGSTIGGFLIGQDRLDEAGANTGIYLGNGLPIFTGSGSDVRFVDFPRIDQFNTVNAQIPIVGTNTITLTDDGGGQVRIQITGVAAGVTAGFIRVLPVDGSQGVAIAQIDADLSGGRALVVTSLGALGSNQVISIGRINITNADAGSAVRFLGPGRIDVWNIRQTEGDPFLEVVNSTPLGDILSVDVVGLTRLTLNGNLGSTVLPSWGPKSIGPFLGLQRDASTAVGGPLGIVGLMAADWNGNTYRPVRDGDYEPGQAFLSDIGSPFDPYLNGMVVRTGNVTDVLVGGSVGDVILQGGSLTQLVANADLNTPTGAFHGIVGTIYATADITTVRVGDGIARRGSSPFSAVGVFAGDDITQVTSNLGGRPAVISGMIMAANLDAGTTPLDGVVTVSLPAGGRFLNAYIAGEQLDGWWYGVAGYLSDERIVNVGDIGTVSSVGAGMFRTVIHGLNVNNVRLTDAAWDASVVEARNKIGTITAATFRNTTLQGQDREYFPNAVIAGDDLNVLSAGTLIAAGDMNDLRVDVLGSVTGSISARDITRAIIDVDIDIRALSASRDIKASRIVAGQLTAAAAARFIRTTNFSISGAIISLTAGDSITDTVIQSTGPDGRIDLVQAVNRLSGTVSSVGPIATVSVTAGDMRARVNTTGPNGNVGTLSAGRDLDIETDIAGNVTALTAGRDIGAFGTRRVILVRGNLADMNGGGGQLFADVRVGQSLTGTATIGRAIHLPSGSNLGRGVITAYGSIATVRVLGDFGGRIESFTDGITLVSINDGSLLPGGLIAAYNGSITNVVINRGHLLGDIHADHIIYAINVNASADGVFGDIGINPDLNPNTPYDPFRNQLPPGVIANTPIQGPRITAGHNIGRITTSDGGVYEAFIHAGRAIGTLTFNGDVRNDPSTTGIGNVIAAGSTMFRVVITGNLFDAAILAGVKSFGADNRPGGVGVNRDTNQLGRLGTVQVGGDAASTILSAGLTAGPDGVYNTPDDTVVPGLSFIRNIIVAGTVSNVSAYSDFPVQNIHPGIVTGGLDAAPVETRLAGGVPAGGVQLPGDGSAFNFATLAGEQGTLRFSGPGRAYWVAAANSVVLLGTRATSDLLVTSVPGSLTNFRIVSNDDATMGTIQVSANLLGDSWIIVDNNIVNLQFNNGGGTPQVIAGGNIRNFTTGTMTGGLIAARFARFVNIVGGFGLASEADEITARFTALGDFTVGGQNSGDVLVERDTFNFRVNGAMSRGVFRSGGNVGTFTAGSLSESRVSVRDRLGPVVVAGNVFDTSIMAGGDLGEDGRPGGTGFNADTATTGHIASVTVGGTFVEADIVAGALRGPDGFFGTNDDSVAAGRSTIGPVIITGTAFGSNLGSEQYRITATGALGPVTIAGQVPTNTGNFRVQGIATAPLPIVITGIQPGWVNGVHQAEIFFNQAMDASTLAGALRIAEARDSGNTLINLVAGVHYTLQYNTATRSLTVLFDRSVTDRNLPQGGNPGPGVFRFTFAGATLRAAVADARLDGDADGFVDPSGDDFSEDHVIGDAGDKIAPVVVGPPNRVDFYGPVDLDLVLDNNTAPDGLPDTNSSYTIRGAIGDHPDHSPDFFGFSSDLDVYRLTLKAGQILQLGPMGGSALFTGVALFNSAGEFQGTDTADSLRLASNPFGPGQLTTDTNYLIRATGTYYIVVGNVPGAFLAGTAVPNIDPIPGGIGDYSFTIRVFDDGDSGFRGDTDSGDGSDLATPPLPIAFAGPDQQFGTSDDLSTVVLGSFSFVLDRGPDGLPDTTDDVVTGTNGQGIVAERRGTQITTTIRSAIGTPGHVGIPGDQLEPDVDVYHLNLGQPVAPGTRYRITVKLSESGADLGSRTQNSLVNWNGEVQLGVFETTNATDVRDGVLVFSPTDFRSSGGTPGAIAATGPFGYGYDANGDFYIDFVAPGLLGASAPASYAVYLQGVFRTDYTLEIVQGGTASYVRPRQNVLIETNGGTIDWLELGGITTTLGAFQASALGFSGSVSGQPVQQYILANLLAKLTAIFDAAGVDVVFSTNPNAFEFQDFSTVFISSSYDPVRFLNEGNYGATQRSDPFNADRNDEAVVFTPSLGLLGFTPSQTDVNDFIDSLTASVARRVGELVGLRFTASEFSSGGDPQTANSPENFGGNFAFTTQSKPLAGRWDVSLENGYFLGHQAAVPLLNKIIRP